MTGVPPPELLRPAVSRARTLPEWHRGAEPLLLQSSPWLVVACFSLVAALLTASLVIDHPETRWALGRIVSTESCADTATDAPRRCIEMRIDAETTPLPRPQSRATLRHEGVQIAVDIVSSGVALDRIRLATLEADGPPVGAVVALGYPGETRSLLRWLVPARS